MRLGEARSGKAVWPHLHVIKSAKNKNALLLLVVVVLPVEVYLLRASFSGHHPRTKYYLFQACHCSSSGTCVARIPSRKIKRRA